MASVTSKSASNRSSRSEKRARALARAAMTDAGEITMRVLEGGQSSVAARPAKAGARRTGQKRASKSGSGQTSPIASPRAAAPIGLQADVTPKLRTAAPAFADVLRSIAHAVAVTQTALDDTALESLKTLAAQQVDVPVLVEQTLDNDGIPKSVTITTASVPLTSIISPSMQVVEQMTLRMDMRVASFDATSGIQFNQNMASAGVSYSAHSFGFAVAVNNTNVNAQFSNLSDFSSGSVMMSMDIVDRTGFQIPTPLEYGIGANLMVRLESLTQTPATTGQQPLPAVRKAVLSVKLVKTTGDVVPAANYTLTLPPGFGLTMTATGFELTRNLATEGDPYVEGKISIILGQLIKEITLNM